MPARRAHTSHCEPCPLRNLNKRKKGEKNARRVHTSDGERQLLSGFAVTAICNRTAEINDTRGRGFVGVGRAISTGQLSCFGEVTFIVRSFVRKFEHIVCEGPFENDISAHWYGYLLLFFRHPNFPVNIKRLCFWFRYTARDSVINTLSQNFRCYPDR